MGLRLRLDRRPGLSVGLRPHLSLSLSLGLNPSWFLRQRPNASPGLSARLSLDLGIGLRPSRSRGWRQCLRLGLIGV